MFSSQLHRKKSAVVTLSPSPHHPLHPALSWGFGQLWPTKVPKKWCHGPPRVVVSKKIYLNYLGVSKNRGTPKSWTLIGFSILNHPFTDLNRCSLHQVRTSFVDFVDFSFYYRILEGLVLNAWDVPPKSVWQKNPHTVATQMITISLFFCLFQKKSWQFHQVFLCFLRSDHMLEIWFHCRNPSEKSHFAEPLHRRTIQKSMCEKTIQDPWFPMSFFFPNILVSAKKRIHIFHAIGIVSPKFQRPVNSPYSLAPAAPLLLALCLNAPPKNSAGNLGVAWRIPRWDRQHPY